MAYSRLKLRPYEALYRLLLSSAKKRYMEVDFSYEVFLGFVSQKHCHYCHADLVWSEYTGKKKGTKRSMAYNLDRKDDQEGYLWKNLVVCCNRCNKGKTHRFTYDEWHAMTEVFRSKEA